VSLGVLLATSALGCRLEGAALLLVMGSVARFSGSIADYLYGPRATRDVITDRRPPDEALVESRRWFASVVRWVIFVWAGTSAVGGLLVLVGVLHCS
jgi:hypothetical protein